MHDFRQLTIWKDSIELAALVYSISKKFPTDERFGLTNQVRRCAVSIASNIAEGAGRNTNGEFIHFLGISTGSCYELETQLFIALKVGYITQEEVDLIMHSLSSIQKRIYNFKHSLLK